MRYEFFNEAGVDMVRISVGADVVVRPVAEGDQAVAERENAAEDAAKAALEKETKERQEREAANEARALGKEPPADESQKKLELEFDSKLEQELAHKGDDDDANGKHKKARKGAE
jgi:hypothetical protein